MEAVGKSVSAPHETAVVLRGRTCETLEVVVVLVLAECWFRLRKSTVSLSSCVPKGNDGVGEEQKINGQV